METLSRTERQKLGVKKWVKAECTATLCYGTGVGKTRTAIIAIELLLKHDPDAYVIISVPTQYLKDQWIEQLEKYNLINNCDVIVVNTIVKHAYKCDLLVIDEIHATASDMFQKIFITVDYKMILGLTATLERLDGKEVVIKQHAPVCDTITLEEATQNGWVSPAKRYLVLLNVDLTEYKELDKKFNTYFSFFGWDFQTAMSCLQEWTFRNKFAKQVGSDPKTVLQMSAQWMKALHARKVFIENHPKKIEVCRQILDARKNTKCITFCPTIKFAETIKRGIVLHSGKKASENKKAIDDFNKATIGVLNSSKMCREGCDIAGLTTGIIMDVDSSKRSSIQKAGRCVRYSPGKTAEIFTLVINNTQEVKWFNNSNTSQYIVIDTEEKLQKVLNHEDIESRERDFGETKQYRF